MIFVPVAIAGTSIFCILTRYCARNFCNNSSDSTGDSDSGETTGCCIGFCPRIFEPQTSHEELSIPFCRSLPFYSSTSIGNSGSNSSLNGSNDAETEFESFIQDDEDVVVDSQIILIVNPSENSKPVLSISPPDLLLLTGDEALKGYTSFLKNTAKTAQGPSVVHVDFNDIKSKSFAKSFDLQEKSDDENSQMDDYDAEYLDDRYRKIMENNKLGIIGRSDSSEKKVQFNGIAELRSFKIEG